MRTMRMARRSWVVGLVLVLGACGGGGDDDAGGGSDGGGDAAGGSAGPGGVPATVSIEGEGAVMSGQWSNDTLGTSGAADVLVSVDAVTGLFTLAIELGDDPFGIGLSTSETFTGVVSPDGSVSYDGTSTLLGTVQASVVDDAITLEAPAVPDPRVASVSASGTITTSGSDIDVEVTLADGEVVLGSLSLAPGSDYSCDDTPAQEWDLSRYSWETFPYRARLGHQLLGWTAASWAGDAPEPDTEVMFFRDLSPTQRIGAELLCWTESEWDES